MKTPVLLKLGCASIALAGAPGIAHAQTAGAAQDSGADESNVIIVTAQKREERLQDVPLTITVVSDEQLQRQTITNVTELQNAAPELNYTGQPSAGYSIRGSGTQTFTRSSENNVLLVIDQVVQGQLTPPTTTLFDIERIEVLSGPQGMLFGKNASAGVVNITTRAPELGEFGGRARVTAGEGGFFVLNGVVNVPLGSTAALRVSGVHEERDGFILNRRNNQTIDDREVQGVRGRFLWEASPALTINLYADHEVEQGGNNVWQSRIAAPGGATSIATLLAACGVVPGPENTEVCIDGPSSRRIQAEGGAFQFDYDLGGPVLTGITAYRHYTRESETDSDTRPINALNSNFASDDIDQWSQEIRIASTGRQTIDYVAGLFFYNYHYRTRVDQGGTLAALPFVTSRSTTNDIRQKSFAVFGQASWNISDQFSLIAGGRFTQDSLVNSYRAFLDPTLGIRFGGFTFPDTVGREEVDTDNFSFRLGAQYRPNRDLTFFTTFSRGYKGPAVNPLIGTTVSVNNRIVRPEEPTNIEAGVKAALFGNRVNVDFTIFHTEVKDFQAQVATLVNGVTTFQFSNADELTFNGAQLNIYARPARGVTLNGGVLYNDTEYGDFTVPCNVPFTTGCTNVGTVAAPNFVINANGQQLANAPRWKVTLGGSVEVPVTASVNAFTDANFVYRSGAPTSPTPDPNLFIDGYAMVDGRIGIRGANDAWSLALFVKNLFDERAPTIIFRDPLVPNGNYNQTYQPNAFRTVGVTLDVSF